MKKLLAIPALALLFTACEEAPNFDIRNVFSVTLPGGTVFHITETVISVWIVMAIMIAIGIAARIALNKVVDEKQIPSGFINFIEFGVESFRNFVKGSAGPKLMFLGHWFFTVFIFVLLSNWIGLLGGLRNPTADWAVTGALGISSFIMINFFGIWYRGGGYIRQLFEPFIPVFGVKLPNIPFGILNIIGELARPISLSFRLFGNILSGMILISLLYSIPSFLGIFPQLGFPLILHGFFDVAIGALQAFVFTVLSLTFIGIASTTSEE